jgi:hypothetical protein
MGKELEGAIYGFYGFDSNTPYTVETQIINFLLKNKSFTSRLADESSSVLIFIADSSVPIAYYAVWKNGKWFLPSFPVLPPYRSALNATVKELTQLKELTHALSSCATTKASRSRIPKNACDLTIKELTKILDDFLQAPERPIKWQF